MKAEIKKVTGCEFVALAYVSDPIQDSPVPIIVVSRGSGSDSTQGIGLRVSIALRTIVDKRHRDYLQELLESWSGTSIDRLDDLFRELRELSSGPLRTHSSGFCSPASFSRLIEEVLGPNEKAEKAFEDKLGEHSHGPCK